MRLFSLPLPPRLSCPSQGCPWAQEPSALTPHCCQHHGHWSTLSVAVGLVYLPIRPSSTKTTFCPGSPHKMWVSYFLAGLQKNFDSNGSYQNYTWVEPGRQRKKICQGKNGKGSREQPQEQWVCRSPAEFSRSFVC